MKKLLFASCLALSLVACGGGGSGSVADLGSAAPTADVLKAKPAAPDPTLVGQPVSMVNTTTAGDQLFHQADALSDGGYAVAWTADGSSFVQRYDSAGAKVGGEISIPTQFDVNFDGAPFGSVAVLTNGDIVVARRTLDSTLSVSAISVTRYDASGSLIAEMEVASQTNPTEGPGLFFAADVEVAALANGGFVVGWNSVVDFLKSGRNNFIMTQRFDSQGAAVGGTVPILSPSGPFPTSGGFEPDIRIVADALGGYSVYVGNFAQVVHVDASGATTRVDTEAGVLAALLLPLEGDRYVLFTTTLTGVFRQFLDAAGAPVGELTRMSVMPTDAKELADGSFVVFWTTGGSTTAQRFDSTGAPMGELLTLQSGGAVPGAAALLDGGFAAAWSAASTAGDLDVFTQRFIEVLSPDQAALRAKRKACLDSAKGMTGQQRKSFVDACLAA